ncbi:hypothetical protein GIB67_007724 [Kingdonia uniflora]|uniref:Cucumisin n=1 Tax=Kingdonia uniflora TaxID=39325 RepID=A0A7J7N1S1_9MAGN|nr:hypothetical protein GIB67_007724 [Kingdonia uniflora]
MAPPAATVLILLIATTISITLCSALDENRDVHIVYMGALPKGEYFPEVHHNSILQESLESSSSAANNLVRSYRKSFNGFAAKLTNQEREKLAKMEGVVSVFPSRTLQLQTTRSWDFMGFKETVQRVPTVESNVIVGVIDSGIWPESDSFTDEGFGPLPHKWKGICNGGENFKCNKKLIGARLYNSYKQANATARDTIGHGSHTASTAAGNQVNGTSFLGLAEGKVRGAVPSARIAVYKACWEKGCEDSDILAAFDDAISDGVDIISLSLGGDSALDYSADAIAIGAFHAMQKNILTSNSAGNNGPFQSTLSSVAPWLLTVAASTTDRRIINKVVLGDGTTLVGNAVNSFDSKRENKLPLLYGRDTTSTCDEVAAKQCVTGCLDESLVQGKIVLCDSKLMGKEPLRVKATGVIMVDDDGVSDVSVVFPLAASMLDMQSAEKVSSYINSTRKPEACILKSEYLVGTDAPVIPSFSSRGPNDITGDILKANISAPGVDILAAWSPVAPPSDVQEDKRSVKYNIISGTSMACPHVTGAAAYIKTFHPDWSPSAIKSALMTTAIPMNSSRNPDAEFSYGAGHIDPVKAINPGLVYDIVEDDYIKMLCSINYTSAKITLISGNKGSSCPKGYRGAPKDLNLPSMMSNSAQTLFSRTVTNVGSAKSTYKAIVTSHSKMKITVTPNALSFKAINEKKSFTVNVSSKELNTKGLMSGSLVWSDGVHIVRSPIVVYRR